LQETVKRKILSSREHTRRASEGHPKTEKSDSATKDSSRRKRHLPKAASSEKPEEEGGAAMDLPNFLEAKAAKALPAALAAREDILPSSAQGDLKSPGSAKLPSKHGGGASS
jgi:hypothetical protein